MICCKVKSFYDISILLGDYLCHSSLFALISLVEMSYGGLPIQSWKQKVDALETLRFTSFRSEWERRGSSVVISFHPHGKIRICGHPSHLRHLRAILPPRVFCGESMLLPRLHFKKCSSTRFDYQVFALHFSFFFKKSLWIVWSELKFALPLHPLSERKPFWRSVLWKI